MSATAANVSTSRRPWTNAPIVVLFAWTLAGCGLASGGAETATGGGEEPTFEFVVPVGSGERIARGEVLDILPREIETQVGDSIVIRNEDTVAHRLGPWFVGAGETLRQRFLTVGVYEGACTVHPDGAFTVVVGPA